MYDVSDRFLDVISGSHRAIVRVQVLPTTEGLFPQFGPNPTGGIELPLLDGDVKLSSTADVNGSVDLSVSGDYWDLLAPFGAEVFVERGVDFGDGTSELVPCGYYGIEEVSRDNRGPVRVSAFDRAKRLQRNRVVYPVEFPAGSTHTAIFHRLVNGILPPGATLLNYAMFHRSQVPIVWTGYDPDIAKIGTSLTCEDDSHAFLSKLADARGCVLRFARTGELLVQPRNLAPGAEPVYSVKPGAGGNLVSWSQKLTRDGVYNYVVARGSDPAHVTSYRLAVNDDQTSPLFWDGPFGNVIRYYASPLLLTNESADIAAETVLARYKGLPSSLSMMAVPNPALDPLDVVQATLAGQTASHLVDQVSIPLAGDAPVEIVTRTLNEVPTDEDPTTGGGTPNPDDPGTGVGSTAAENYDWGTPLAASDDFTSGVLDLTKWAVYSGAGQSGNGHRVPARVAIVNGILTITGLANADTGGLEHKLDQQYGRWEIRVRSSRTGGDPSGGGGGSPTPGPTAQTLGVGGVAAPSGAILATTDSTATLTITTGGTATSPRVYDGQGHKCGPVRIRAPYVTVQNYRVDAGHDPHGVEIDSVNGVTFQNNDISNVGGTGGDINAITAWGCDQLKLLYNTSVNFVGGDPGDSHTDWFQTWISSSHPVPMTNLEIGWNKATGPANLSRNSSIPSIHQDIMAEGYQAPGSGNTGGNGQDHSNWSIHDNEFGDSWNQAVKLNGVDNVTISDNRFVGSSDKVMDVSTASTGVVFYDDNQVGSGYGAVGMTVTPAAGTGTSGGGGGATVTTLLGWSGDDNIPGAVNEVKGTWMVRDSWANMALGNYLTEGTFGTFVAANPTRAADIGVPLIPHDSTGTTGWNALLDSVVAGSHDADHFAMGAKLAQRGPRTVFARLWWEMNMTITQPDYTKFKNAWNRAVPNIRAGFASAAASGQTLKIVYCYLPDRDNQDDMYPGNTTVDIVGADIYAKKYQSVTPTSQELLDAVQQQLDALTQFGAARGKPTSLGEWANWQQLPANGVVDSRGRGDFPAYIDQVFDWIEATNPAYVVHFNITDGTGQLLTANTPNSLARYQARAAALQL